MKHSRYIFIALAAATILSACSREEESLFEMSAAERAAYALNKADSTLLSATNGWEMLYTPSYDYRGYNLLVKFEENGGVKFATKNALTTNNKYEEDSNSTWNLVSDQGPILTFDTHNSVLHKFCDPDEGGSALSGKGYEGDFEFLILRTTDNQMLLKGKKRGTYIILNRLEEDLNWENYFTQVEEASANIFANNNIFELQMDGKTYSLFNGSEGIFYLTEKGVEPDQLELDVYPFSNTRTGIALTAGFLDNKQDRIFTLQDGVLKGENSTISAGNLQNHFDYYARINQMAWKINIDDINPEMADSIAELNKQLQSVVGKNAKVLSFNIFYEIIPSYNINVEAVATYAVQMQYTLDGKKSESPAVYYYDNVCTDDNITLTYNKPKSDEHEQLLTVLPKLGGILKMFNGSYIVTSDNRLNPTLGAKLINQDKNLWYNITGTKQ